MFNERKQTYACSLTLAASLAIGAAPPRSAQTNVSSPAAETAARTTTSVAAAQNAELKNQLVWSFAGQPQRGWSLYAPLISRLLDIDDESDARRFAEKLSRWQKSVGLAPSGVLNEETLLRMIAAWQSQRIKDRAYPQPSQLLAAPASDFYDPSRPDELRQVERQTYTAYKRLVAAAVKDKELRLAATREGELAPSEKFLKIISAFRSKEYQEQLRRKTPNAGRAGLAVNSPHFTGRALDLYVGGEPVETKDSNRAVQTQTRVYKWLVRNASRFGFYPYFYEPWHWEHVGR